MIRQCLLNLTRATVRTVKHKHCPRCLHSSTEVARKKDSDEVSPSADASSKHRSEELLSPQTIPAEPPEFPSDVDEDAESWRAFNKKYRLQDRHAYRPKVDPKSTSIVLFPGQGSQFVGMGKDLLQYPGVEDLYHVASSILGYDLLQVCLSGPKEKLDRTVYCQPAVVVTALAAIEKLRHKNPQAIEQCISTAGFSVGEYAALTFADAMSFEDAVRTVQKRAELMQELSETEPSGMMTVIMGADAKLKYCLHTARLYCSKELGMEEPVCDVAISLYPEVKVIAGHAEALDFVETNGREFGIRRTKRLPVSGAFHTKIMKPAKEKFSNILNDVEIRRPLIPVFSNVHSRRYQSPNAVRAGLVQQLFKPVKWEQTMHVLYSRPKGSDFPNTWEIGPGNQLGTILKQTNKLAHSSLTFVGV